LPVLPEIIKALFLDKVLILMIDYISKAFSVWFIGFFPAFEIYIAVPAGIAMGLDYYSTIIWSVAGNYTPILLIHHSYQWLIKIPRIKKWFYKLSSQRLKRWVDTYGIGFVLLVTPWIGVWIMAITMKLLKMKSSLFLIYSFFSIFIYAVTIATLIKLGVDFVKN
jgi:hypothetical protein